MILDMDKIDKIVKKAIESFNENEQYLMKNSLNELSVYSKFAEYLNSELQKEKEFAEYKVDTNWNRGYHGIDSNIKELNGKQITLDLIVHKRGYDVSHGGYQNLICMEFKKVGNSVGYSEDEKRLESLTYINPNPNENFWYKIGYMIRISEKKSRIDIKSRFMSGKKI